MSYLRRLYYDTALAASSHTLSSLLQVSDCSHIVYGSDWPWAPDSMVMSTNQQLESSEFFSEKDRARIYRDNAIELIARLASLPDA